MYFFFENNNVKELRQTNIKLSVSLSNIIDRIYWLLSLIVIINIIIIINIIGYYHYWSLNISWKEKFWNENIFWNFTTAFSAFYWNFNTNGSSKYHATCTLSVIPLICDSMCSSRVCSNEDEFQIGVLDDETNRCIKSRSNLILFTSHLVISNSRVTTSCTESSKIKTVLDEC